MTLNEVRECYELLLSACRAESGKQRAAYRQMRDLLERLCRDEAHEPGLQMTDLAARVNFLAAKKGLAPKELNRLHTFRLTSNRVLNRQEEPSAERLLRDAKTLAFLLQRLTGEEIPPALRRLLPQADATYLATPPHRQWVQRMRVCYLGRDEHRLPARFQAQSFHHAFQQKGLARTRIARKYEHLIVGIEIPFPYHFFRVPLIGRQNLFHAVHYSTPKEILQTFVRRCGAIKKKIMQSQIDNNHARK